MEPHKRLILAASLFFTLTVSLLALVAPSAPTQEGPQHPMLLVECDNATLTLPLDEPARLEYTWIHSVEKTPITEVYLVTPRGLTLVEARAQSFGAGHPYSSEEIGGGETRILDNGTIVYGANYTIGRSLEILGHPDYQGRIIVEASGLRASCEGFVWAKVAVVEPGTGG